MAVQTNRNFMSDLEFQKRFPNLYNQQGQQSQQGQQAPFGGPLGSGTPYQGLTAPTTNFSAPAPLDITSPLNLGSGVYGGANTPSSLAGSIYGDAAQPSSGMPSLAGDQTSQAAFGNIVKPAIQTGQAAFGSITQPTATDNLVKEVVGPDGQKPAAPDDSGMSDQLIEQLQVAEDARLKQVIREEEAKKLDAENKVREEEAKKLAEDAALTPQQRTEKYTPVLRDQILGQQLTDKWSGQGHGNPAANATHMAQILSNAGITDIKQFGKVPVYERAVVGGYKYNGNQLETTPTDEYGNGGGEFYYRVPTGETTYNWDDGTTTPVYRAIMVPKDAKVEPIYGKTNTQDNGENIISSFEAIDPSQLVMKNGALSYKTGESYGNKVTGQAIPANYDRAGGNIWSGTFAGKGSTSYGVQFQPDGTPVFYTQYGGSTSSLGKLAPLLAIASFIPGLQPFAMAANALIAAKQGNVLGAIAGLAGLGGLSNVANAANFAGAVKNKNLLGMISSGANLGGTDLDGLAQSSGFDTSGLAGLNLGGLGVSDALKAYKTVEAIKSGNPSAIISTLGGYAKDAYNQDENSRGFASASDLSRSLAGRSSVPVEDRQFSLPSTDDDFSSSYGLTRSKDDLTAALPGLPELPEFGDDLSGLLPELPKFGGDLTASLPEMPSVDEDFPSSFAEATPKQASRSVASRGSPAARPKAYDSVGGGRGGQGGATAEEVARYNAVRGNAPQTEVAKLVSSLFPSAEAGSLPANRGQDSASQILGQSVKAPASTSDQENSMVGRLADELGLPQEFQRNVSNTLNALPGMNMPVGAVRGVNAASRVAGAADEVGATKYLDEAGRYIPGSNAYKAPEYASEATRMTADPMKMFKMIQDLPNDVYKTPAVQTALKAIAEGDNVAAFKALESNPAAKKELLKYADKIGAQEVSPFKNINLPNPAKYKQKVGGGFAGGGLASLKKRQLAKA